VPPNKQQSSAPEGFLTAPAVCARYSISRMGLWRWLEDWQLAFPKPALRVRGRRYWREADLTAWDRSHIPHGSSHQTTTA
jgi:predicted DNA-binding transcriptional regulator AlpA